MTDTDTGTTLLDLNLDRTLDLWLRRFSQPQWRGRHVEGWLFEGQAERRAAEQRLAAAGVQALCSAYKPLVQHFIDNVGRAQLVAAHVGNPVPQIGPAQARLEACTLAACCPKAGCWRRDDALLHYDIELELQGGKRLTQRVHALQLPQHRRRQRRALRRPRAGCAWAPWPARPTCWTAPSAPTTSRPLPRRYTPCAPIPGRMRSRISSACSCASTCPATSSLAHCPRRARVSARPRRCTRTCYSLLDSSSSYQRRPLRPAAVARPGGRARHTHGSHHARRGSACSPLMRRRRTCWPCRTTAAGGSSGAGESGQQADAST